MKKTLVHFLIFCFLFVSSFVSASAWDDTGHKLVAYIAWQQMTPQARERAVKILLSAPEDSDLSVFYTQNSLSDAAKQRDLFMIAATWADIVRDDKFKVRNAKYHHANWHYLDTFWREVNGKVEIVTELKSDEQNAVERLFFFDKVLRDASASDGDKAIALAWILHLCGDIHQPLHDSARVTQYDPKGDKGGNAFMLSPKEATGSNRINLHWYWDSIVGRSVPRVNDACDSDYLLPIAEQMMQKYPFAKMQKRLDIGKFDEWQKEGFQISSTRLYPSTLKFGELPSESYRKMAFDIAEEQIALAGYRLGEMLNQIFGGQQSAERKVEKGTINISEQATAGSKVGQGADDKWIWFKVRASLITINDLRDSTINVDVENNVVTLRGTVLNKFQKDTAISAAKKVEGVKQVKDMLTVVSK